MKLSKAQGKQLNMLKEIGGWVVLGTKHIRMETMNSLIKLGLVEKRVESQRPGWVVPNTDIFYKAV